MPKKSREGDTPMVGDVLMWTEPDWHRRRKMKHRFFKKGERRVTAQVLEIARDYVHLEVLKCVVLHDRSFTGVALLRAGERITRKRSTLKSRKAERLPWAGPDGEGARSLAKSRFLGHD